MKATATRIRLGGAVLLAVTVALVVGACGSESTAREEQGRTTASPTQTRSVKIALFRFQPGTLEVEAGTAVTWRNQDAILHTVTHGTPGEPAGSFDHELADKGTSASVTFDEPGTFPYFCARHPEAMLGEITVLEARQL